MREPKFEATEVSNARLATSGFVPTFPDRRDGSFLKWEERRFKMFKNGMVVKDEEGKLFVIAEITTKVVLCYQFPQRNKPAVYVFNPYQLKEVPEKGIVVDNSI